VEQFLGELDRLGERIWLARRREIAAHWAAACPPDAPPDPVRDPRQR